MYQDCFWLQGMITSLLVKQKCQVIYAKHVSSPDGYMTLGICWYLPRRECWKWSCWGQNCWLSMAAAWCVLCDNLDAYAWFAVCLTFGSVRIVVMPSFICPSVIMGRARVWRIMQLSIISRALCRVLFYCFMVTWAGLILFLLLWSLVVCYSLLFYACCSVCGCMHVTPPVGTMHGSQPVSSPG